MTMKIGSSSASAPASSSISSGRGNPVPIGIDAIAFAVPSGYVELSDLATARGVPPAKYIEGLGNNQMAVAGPHEDPVTLAAEAASRLFATSGRSPSEIGLCIVGTETAVDHSKPVASYLHGLLGMPQACRIFETKHACFGGTAGLFNALDWLASGSARGRSALVVCTDIARYPLRSPGEPTQGAGAIAMIISERPRLVEIEPGQSGSYAQNVHDFWRPLHRKDAIVDGQFSVQCYLDALTGAYREWQRLGADGGPLVRTCYHVPYGKMARKAHQRRAQLDGVDEATADARYGIEVGPSLRLPSQVGNVYTGSLYLSLLSLLEAEAAALAGQRIGLFSYGSGCAAEFFAGRVSPEAAALIAAMDVTAPLRHRRRLTIPEYEELRQGDAEQDRRPAPEGAAASGANQPATSTDLRAHYYGIDAQERRVYGWQE
jgi:hydroxymethylglutaryl-CoA synthase